MNNVFLSLRQSFGFKAEQLRKIVANEANKDISSIIDSFFESQHNDPLDYANLLRDIIAKSSSKENIEKLLHLIVYLATLADEDEVIKIFESIKAIKISPILLVKFYSFVFKSVSNNKIKKWLISSSLQAMDKEQKTTPFISFIENFELILDNLHLESHQVVEIYWKLINYLEKHVIQQILLLNLKYIFVALSLVNKGNVVTQTVTKLIVKAIYSDSFDDESIDVLNKDSLKAHQLYSLLEARMTGDITALDNIAVWEKFNLEKQKISRKVRIEAIPRLFKSIKQASYAQAAQMLGIQKKEVEGYIIEAVRLGIMKAKLDEFQQTILINKLTLRCLQKSEQIQLQKEITDLCQSLENVSV